MKQLNLIAPAILALAMLSGCASTFITSRQEYNGPKIARPEHILVYDFAATPTDVAHGSAIDSMYDKHREPQTAKQIETGRKLGALVAESLVNEIQDMGLSAIRASSWTKPHHGDLVIKGYFVSIEKGSTDDRLLVGFGSGAAQLQTVVEGYLMTNKGLRLLGTGQLDSEGNKTPGILVGAASFAATANPVGLIVGGANKILGEEDGSETIEGAAKRTAQEIADQLRIKFTEQGWI